MFGREIYNSTVTLNVFEEQANLKEEIDKFNDFTRSKS